MAIEFARVTVHSRSAGHSSVAGAAYRAAETLQDERTGLTARYGHRANHVGHSEILLPDGADATFRDRATLWNAVEAREDRSNRHATAQVAKDHVIALPRELGPEQHIELARGFAREMFVSQGVPVDLAVHYHSEGNPHAHLYTPTRTLEGSAFGKKARELNGAFAKGYKLRDDELIADRWTDYQRRYFAREGLDLEVVRKGEFLEATPHLGPAGQVEKSGEVTELGLRKREVEARNLERLRKNPTLLIEMVCERHSVFREADLRRLGAPVIADPAELKALVGQALESPSVVKLADHVGDQGRGKFTTNEMIATESAMARRAERLAGADSHGAPAGLVRRVLSARPHLSDEQRVAVAHVTGRGRIAAVAGWAGAGKSTMLDAAREAWEAGGYRARGAALAGIAAEGLSHAAGMEARTLHSWEMSWKNGRDQLGRRDVLVIDEAGMVGSRQLARVLETVEKAGAKAVLVGDAEQLQPIEGGAPFRAIAERIGAVDMIGVRRQAATWQRRASRLLASGRTERALLAYQRRGHVHGSGLKSEAVDLIARDYLSDRSSASKLVLAHANESVNSLNEAIRAGRQARGEIGEGLAFKTESGNRLFAIGDRILFRRNDRALGVKNGSLGTVTGVYRGALTARLDAGGEVRVETKTYGHFDHGYAMTIHKSQGATVDRSFVLGTGGMNRHLTYVAMSRHRARADLYIAGETFGPAHPFRRLARAARSETTLDYLERRGFDTLLARIREGMAWLEAQRSRLTALWERAEAAVSSRKEADMALDSSAAVAERREPDPAGAYDLPPHRDPAGRDSLGRGLDAASLEKAVDASPAVAAGRKQLEGFAEVAYQDPKVALAQLERWAKEEGTAKTAEVVRKAPERVGALRGQDGLLAGREAARARRDSLGATRGLARGLESLGEKTEQAKRDYIQSVEKQQRADAKAVPSLSEQARRHLAEIRGAGRPEAVAKAYKALEADGVAMSEIRGYEQAVKARLGRETTQKLARGAEVRVAGAAPRQVAEVARNLQTVQRGQDTLRQVQKQAIQQKPPRRTR